MYGLLFSELDKKGKVVGEVCVSGHCMRYEVDIQWGVENMMGMDLILELMK